MCPLSLDLVNEFLVVAVHLLDIFDSPDLHLFVEIITLGYQVFGRIRELVKLPDYLLAAFFEHVDRLLFLHEGVTGVLYDALNTDQFHAGVAEVLQ